MYMCATWVRGDALPSPGLLLPSSIFGREFGNDEGGSDVTLPGGCAVRGTRANKCGKSTRQKLCSLHIHSPGPWAEEEARTETERVKLVVLTGLAPVCRRGSVKGERARG